MEKTTTMSVQYKPDAVTEKQYDREAAQYREYFVHPITMGDELFAESASVPYMKRLDVRMAKQGEP
jgi:hypothetical protein